MLKLLNASFYKLFRSKVFWVCFGISSALSVVNIVFATITHKVLAASGGGIALETHYFNYHYAVSALVAVFASLFIGTEYSDGALRNKLTVGAKRSNVYFSNFVVTLTVCMMMAVVWIVVGLIGIATIGNFATGLNALACIACGILAMIALCAVFTFIAMLCNNRAVSAVVMLLTLFVLAAVTPIIWNVLQAPPEFESWEYVDGEMQMVTVENSSYVSGALRGFLEFLIDFLPTGIFATAPEILHPVNMPIYSVVTTAAVTVGGIVAFSRKNIK